MGIPPAHTNRGWITGRLHDDDNNESAGRGEGALAGPKDRFDAGRVQGLVERGGVEDVFERVECTPYTIGDVQFQHNPRLRDYKTCVGQRRIQRVHQMVKRIS